MELERARAEAEVLVEFLRPTCERIEIAGSIRREKLMVKDIEIVAIPILKQPVPEFGEGVVHKTELDRRLYNLQRDRKVQPIKGGSKYKQFALVKGLVAYIKVDLFLVIAPAQWGVIDVIRTGPAEFSMWMVTQKAKHGALPNGYHVKGGCVVADEQADYRISMPEEINFFTFCGLKWVEPRDRRSPWE